MRTAFDTVSVRQHSTDSLVVVLLFPPIKHSHSGDDPNGVEANTIRASNEFGLTHISVNAVLQAAANDHTSTDAKSLDAWIRSGESPPEQIIARYVSASDSGSRLMLMCDVMWCCVVRLISGCCMPRSNVRRRSERDRPRGSRLLRPRPRPRLFRHHKSVRER